MITKTSALVVIDMQKGSFTPATPRYDTAGVVERINVVAEALRSMGRPVIYIQHDGTKQSDFLPGSKEWEVLDELDIQSTDIRISKTVNDCFYGSDLRQVLDASGSTHLIITGCATDFCVAATVQSALAKDYTISVLSDGHTTADRPHLSAQKIIEHYNWVWQDLLPTRGSIEVIETAVLLH